MLSKCQLSFPWLASANCQQHTANCVGMQQLKRKIQQTLRLRRALRLVWKSGPGWAIANVVLQVVQGTLPLLSLYLMKLIVDAVETALEAPGGEIAFGGVLPFIALAGVVALVSAFCRSLANLVNQAQAEVVTDYVYDILHSHSIELDLEYYESSQYYDTLHRAQREAPFRPTRIVNNLAQIVRSGISLVAIAGLLFSLHWGIAVILFVAAVPGIWVRLKSADQMYSWQRKRTWAERQAQYFSWMLTDDGHAKEIRLFDLGTLFRQRFRKLRYSLRKERLAIATRRSMLELATQTCATFAVFGSFALVAYLAVQGSITLGSLVMYYQAFQRAQGFLRQMLTGVAGLYENNLFLSNFYEFLNLKPKLTEPTHPETIPNPMQTGIAFNQVSFQYATSLRKTLKEIDLTIQPGEVVALVGENGSGKTTLIKLLCRLYEPSEGNITCDGIDLRRFATKDLRRQTSVIFQDYAKYHLSARENIWLGNTDYPREHEEITAAARQAGADEVITSLPQGYENILGNWFDQGEELSIGQWQKVALARAFLRDSQIIVLDEPTSALDPKAEYEVFKKFRQLIEGKAAILVTHRLSTVKMADRILVMEKGKITESGTHEELMQQCGTYAHLFETQAQHYR